MPPAVSAYDEWQKTQADRPGAATARRLLVSWDSALVRAWQVVHGIRLDQKDPDVALPESILDAYGAFAGEANPGTYRAADEGGLRCRRL